MPFDWSSALLLIVGGVLSTRVVVRMGFIAPASVFSLVTLMSMVVFYCFGILGVLIPDTMRNAWQFQRDYSEVGSAVLAFYDGLLLIPLLATIRDRHGKAFARTKTSAVSSGLSVEAHRTIRRLLSSPAALFLLLLVSLLCVLHWMDVDFSMILRHYQYLITRDPGNVGLVSPVTAFVHLGLGPLGCVSLCLAVLYVRVRIGWLAVVAVAIAIYCAMFSLGGASRWVSVQCAATAAMWQVTSRRRWSRGAILFGVLTLMTYLLVIYARSFHVLGLIPIMGAAVRGEFFLPELWSIVGFSLFSGGFVLADALTETTLTYPFLYKILSFAPTISWIDGFDSLLVYQYRVNVIAPFSNFAEVYHFGIVYMALYFAFLVFALRTLGKFWKKTGANWAFLVVVPAYLAFFNMHLYPIRNSFRMILYPVLLAWWFSSVARTRVSMPTRSRFAVRPSNRFAGMRANSTEQPLASSRGSL